MKATNLRRLRYWVTFDLLALLLLCSLVLLPLVVTNVLTEVLAAPRGQRYPLWTVPHRTVPPSHTTLHLHVVALDEVRQRVTLEIAGYDICPPTCDRNVRVQFFSLLGAPAEGLPAGASMTLPAGPNRVMQEIQLPIEGQPLRYPFDTYDLWLGVVLEEVLPDGTVRAVPPAEASAQLFVAVEERLPQMIMTWPTPIDPQQVQSPTTPVAYVQVAALSFERLVHVRVLAVVLVLLAAAVACSVFVRPFQDLIINLGGLVIGFWVMRSMLTPSDMRHVTAVDMALSVIIVGLLLAITIRAMLILREGRQLQPRRTWRSAARSEARADHSKQAPGLRDATRRHRVPRRAVAAIRRD